MKWGCYKAFGFGMLTFFVVSAQANPNNGHGGFEIGNGGMLNALDGRIIESIDEMECAEVNGKISEILAPASDGFPRTRLVIDVFPLALSAEEALENFFKGGRRGWNPFNVGRLTGIHRELEVRTDWNRLELQVFKKYEKFVIRLEGNKKRSAAYLHLAESLLTEIGN